MKENGFKFKESYANSIKAMNDKQAGKFIKFLCDYVFFGRLPETNDATIKSTFNLIKTQIDRDIKCREYGRLGGIKSAEKRRLEKGEFVLVIDEKNEANPLKNLVKNIMEGDTKN